MNKFVRFLIKIFDFFTFIFEFLIFLDFFDPKHVAAFQ